MKIRPASITVPLPYPEKNRKLTQEILGSQFKERVGKIKLRINRKPKIPKVSTINRTIWSRKAERKDALALTLYL